MKAWKASIYPIWATIIPKENSDPEIALLHKADLAIYRSGLRPNRGVGMEKKATPAGAGREGWGE
jgi:hypothetical protein